MSTASELRAQNPYKQAPSAAKFRRDTNNSHHSSNPKQHPAFHNKKQVAVPAPAERWVVVVKNVESDMAKIHENAVERYCSLNPSHRRVAPLERKPKPAAEAEQGEGSEEVAEDSHHIGEDTTTTVAAHDDGIRYEIVSRSETRSAEVVITRPATADGPALVDVSSIFLPLSQSFAGTGHNPRHTKPAKSQNKNNQAEEQTEEMNQVESPAAAAAVVNEAPRYTSIEDMVAVLCQKPYFTHPPTFVLGEGLAASDEKKVIEPKLRKQNKKRARDEADGETVEEGEEDASTTTPSQPANVTRGGRQRELATAIASLSTTLPAKAIKKLLADIPGFLSAWGCGGRQVRLVFKTTNELWKAKSLLDQFEADGVRVKIQLPDSMLQAYNAFTAAEEEQL